MGFVAVKCPSCGAEVNLDESREFGFCTYCGTKIVQDKIVVEHRGQISVDGISTKESTLERANNFLEHGDFERATIYYNKALDLDPKSAIVYWKLLLCRLKLKNNEQMLQLYASPSSTYSIDLKNYSEYENALRYANEEQLEEFLSVSKKVEQKKSDEYATAYYRKYSIKVYSFFFVMLLVGVVLSVIINMIVGDKSFGAFSTFIGIIISFPIGAHFARKEREKLEQELTPEQIAKHELLTKLNRKSK